MLRTQQGTKQKNSLPLWSLHSRGRDRHHSGENKSDTQPVLSVKLHGEGGKGPRKCRVMIVYRMVSDRLAEV